jgi:uncharacterized protein (DUF1778 family)
VLQLERPGKLPYTEKDGKEILSMPARAEPKTKRSASRLEARVSRETKALCQKAANLQGRSLTDFVVQSAVEAAMRVVRDHEVIELSQRDRAAFVEALLNSPEPNTRMLKAAKRHAQIFAR